MRGHQEQADSNTNPGNFRALLEFRIDAGDNVLADHFKSGAQNARYISPQIQSDLIACRKQIIQEVQNAKFCSVFADEAADISNREQLHLVDPNNTIREEFVDFVSCDTGTSGSAVAHKILEALQGFGLDTSYLRGQAFDGAGNMAVNLSTALLTVLICV